MSQPEDGSRSRRSHDALFKSTFGDRELAAAHFGHTLPPALRDGLLLDQLQVVKGSFVGPRLRHRHTDLLFSVPSKHTGRDGKAEAVLIFLLLEHQTSVDRDMPLRLAQYRLRIWEDWRKQHGRPGEVPWIHTSVLYTGKRPWTAAPSIGDMVIPTQDRQAARQSVSQARYQLLNLEDFVDGKAQLPDALRVVLQMMAWVRLSYDAEAMLTALRDLAPTTKTMLQTQGPIFVEQVFTYLLEASKLTAEDVRMALLDGGVEREVVNMAMTGAERLLAEGKAQGLAEGRAEGRATTLIELLEDGFGPLSDDVRTRVHSATEAELRSWTRRILSAQSLADVFKDS